MRLIDKYIDGELTDEEAAAFMASVENDPELESELRSWEATLNTVASAHMGTAPAGLTDEVMARVRAAAPAAPAAATAGTPAWRMWIPRLAWVAALAAIFVVGRFTAPSPTGDAPGHMVTSTNTAGPSAVVAASAPATLRAIQLVFVPDDDTVGRVSVAGTFNGWSTTATPMERRGDVFVAQVVLPPGSYEYMFVVDGDDWVTDPLAMQTRDDGFGRENAVLDITL